MNQEDIELPAQTSETASQLGQSAPSSVARDLADQLGSEYLLRSHGRIYHGIIASGNAKVHNSDHVIYVYGDYYGRATASKQTFGDVVGLSVDWIIQTTQNVFHGLWQTLTLANEAPRPPLGTYAIFRDFFLEEFKVDIGTVSSWDAFEFTFWQREEDRELDTDGFEWSAFPELLILYSSLQKGLTNGFCLSTRVGEDLLLIDPRKSAWTSTILPGRVYQFVLPPDDTVDLWDPDLEANSRATKPISAKRSLPLEDESSHWCLPEIIVEADDSSASDVDSFDDHSHSQGKSSRPQFSRRRKFVRMVKNSAAASTLKYVMWTLLKKTTPNVKGEVPHRSRPLKLKHLLAATKLHSEEREEPYSRSQSIERMVSVTDMDSDEHINDDFMIRFPNVNEQENESAAWEAKEKRKFLAKANRIVATRESHLKRYQDAKNYIQEQGSRGASLEEIILALGLVPGWSEGKRRKLAILQSRWALEILLRGGDNNIETRPDADGLSNPHFFYREPLEDPLRQPGAKKRQKMAIRDSLEPETPSTRRHANVWPSRFRQKQSVHGEPFRR